MTPEIISSVIELLTAINDRPVTVELGHEKAAPMLPQMRTLPQVMTELKRADPETAVTLSALRRAVKQGRIPSVTVESKTLVNMVAVYDYFSGNYTGNNTDTKSGIRKIGG